MRRVFEKNLIYSHSERRGQVNKQGYFIYILKSKIFYVWQLIKLISGNLPFLLHIYTITYILHVYTKVKKNMLKNLI